MHIYTRKQGASSTDSYWERTVDRDFLGGKNTLELWIFGGKLSKRSGSEALCVLFSLKKNYAWRFEILVPFGCCNHLLTAKKNAS